MDAHNTVPRPAPSLNSLQAICAQISLEIKLFSDVPGTYGIPCFNIASILASISFTFTTQEGKRFAFTILSTELSVGLFRSDPELCQTPIDFEDFSIVSGSLLKRYYGM